MKKFLLTLCASTPSVKGIYMIVFLNLITCPIFSQVEKIQPNKSVQKWELGIDAGSIFLKENSSPLFLRYYLKNNQALRMGLGISFKHQYSQNARFEYFDSSSIRAYNSVKTNTYGSTMFFGYQIEKEVKRFSLYTASDLLFNYSLLKDEVIPDSIFIKYSPSINRFFANSQRNLEVISSTFCQSIGMKIPIQPRFSLSVETAMTVSLSRIISKESLIGYIATPTGLTAGHLSETSEKNWIIDADIARKWRILVTYHF